MDWRMINTASFFTCDKQIRQREKLYLYYTEGGDYHAGWFAGEPEEFFFSVIYIEKIWSWKPKKLQFQTRYQKRLMWPIVLCKLLKIMTIHLGDAKTTTCVKLAILWAGLLLEDQAKKTEMWEEKGKNRDRKTKEGGRGGGGRLGTNPSCRRVTLL